MRSYILITLTFIITPLMLACERSAIVPSNTLVMGVESGPRLLDPRLYTDAMSYKIGDLIFNGLVKRSKDFSIVPDLASKWETPTNTRYVFSLRNGIKFHNGAPLTSYDIKYAFEYVLVPENKSPWKGVFEVIASISTPDPMTVVFDLKRPSAPFLGNLTMGITPNGSGVEMANKPIGTGPFKFVDYKTEERLTLKAFQNYFDGAPKLDGVILKIIPDETVRVLELEKGGLHLLINPITPDILPRFRKNKSLKVVTALGTNYSYLGFNLRDSLAGQLAVRRAIAYALDRESVIHYILRGLAKSATGPLSKASSYFYGHVATYEHNPALAKKILDEAGYRDPDGNGPKLRFTLQYSTSQNELRKRIAEIFQWQLSKIGIGLDIRSYEWGTFYSNIKKGNFQMFSLTWVGIVDPDILHYMFHTSSFPPYGANRGRYENSVVDDLSDLGRITFGNERKAVYSQIQSVLAHDLPYVSLWHSVNVAVMNNQVSGFVLAADENLKFLANVTLMPGVGY
jgi:peptide/nickel transport system substrate-binding protein